MAIYLVHTTAPLSSVMAEGLAEDSFEPTAGLILVETSQSRSWLYHRLKAIQRSDDPLLVTELIDVPKFKGMAPGSLAWLRSRLG